MNEEDASTLKRWGFVPLRMVVGVVFLMHGVQKVFDFGLHGTTDLLDKLGIPLPAFFAVVIIVVELLGGMAIVLGLFARWAAALLAIEMTVAILVARLGGGFFTPYGYEFELTLWGACLTIAALGTGGISLGTRMRRREQT